MHSPYLTDDYRIIFWNARGIRHKLNELVDLIQAEEIDIVALNETFLDEHINLPSIANYSTVRIDKTNHSGGLLFIIKSSLSFTELDCPNTQLFECAAIQINTLTPFVLYLIYCPGVPGQQTLITSNFTIEITQICNNQLPYFVVGDFNAKHRAWDCVRNNRTGKLLKDFIDNSRNFLSVPDNPTYSPLSTRMSPSVIDLMISDGRIASSALRTREIFTSDHYPVEFEIYCNRGPVTPSLKAAYDYSRANWNNFKTVVEDQLNPLYDTFRHSSTINNANIDNIVSALSTACLDAQEAAVPISRVAKNSFICTPLLRSLINTRNYYRRNHTNPQ